jgi:2-methylisocitrate lyase-like PEP mutase family enzyme
MQEENQSASQVSDRMATESSDLDRRCDVLRSLHAPGTPLVLANAWDAASARAVVAAGFPVVATTSGGVAAALGYEDHEHAPSAEMLAAAGRIARSVDVPVTVDAEAGYGMEPADLVAALQEAGAAGCNLEDTNHAAGELRDPESHAAWLRAVREAANTVHYPLVINARIDVFLSALLASSNAPQRELLPDALPRARAYLDAGVDCVFPIALWEADALREFVSGAPGPVNVLKTPRAPSFGELAKVGVARISYGSLLHRDAMEQFGGVLGSIAAESMA